MFPQKGAVDLCYQLINADVVTLLFPASLTNAPKRTLKKGSHSMLVYAHTDLNLGVIGFAIHHKDEILLGATPYLPPPPPRSDPVCPESQSRPPRTRGGWTAPQTPCPGIGSPTRDLISFWGPPHSSVAFCSPADSSTFSGLMENPFVEARIPGKTDGY